MTSTSPFLSKEEDDWLRERYESEVRWIATLSNGERIIQDDYRPDVLPQSAWLRLKKYCELNSVNIESMYLQFRSHIEHVPAGKQGYYFCRAVLGEWGAPKSFNMYNVGVVHDNGDVEVTKWRTPELIPIGSEIRTIEECKDLLICKYV